MRWLMALVAFALGFCCALVLLTEEETDEWN